MDLKRDRAREIQGTDGKVAENPPSTAGTRTGLAEGPSALLSCRLFQCN